MFRERHQALVLFLQARHDASKMPSVVVLRVALALPWSNEEFCPESLHQKSGPQTLEDKTNPNSSRIHPTTLIAKSTMKNYEDSNFMEYFQSHHSTLESKW